MLRVPHQVDCDVNLALAKQICNLRISSGLDFNEVFKGIFQPAPNRAIPDPALLIFL